MALVLVSRQTDFLVYGVRTYNIPTLPLFRESSVIDFAFLWVKPRVTTRDRCFKAYRLVTLGYLKTLLMEAIRLKKSAEHRMKSIVPNSLIFVNDNSNMTEHLLNPEKWIDSYADYLFNYTIGRVNDAEIAKDLVQETFFAGLKSAKNYKGDAAERTWLIAILKRKIIDHYRKTNSKKGRAEVRMDYNAHSDAQGDWLEEQIADPFSSFETDAIENQELGQAIHSCIAQLPKKQALVFSMKTIQGMDTETICNELDINPSNLWVMIHRARAALMGCLNQNWFES